MRGLPVILLAALLGTFGCASSGTGDGGSTGGSRNLIVHEELTDPAIAPLSALEAVERLRPRWLRSRGAASGAGQTLPVVYMNGSRYGELHTLRSIPVSDIEEIRFINARDATTRFGTGVAGGVIAVESRR